MRARATHPSILLIVPNVRSVRLLRAVPVLVLGILAGCGDDPHKPKVDPTKPAAIAVTSGANQVGAPSAPLPAPIVAHVTNAQGTGIAGAPVAFSVVRGLGMVANAPTTTVTTDGAGNAQVGWTLGNGAVRQQIAVTAGTVTQSVDATVDTSRALYISLRDTANVGDTLRVWAAAGLAGAPGEVWGAVMSTLTWTDTGYVTPFRIVRVDSSARFYYHFAPSGKMLTTAASFPTNPAGTGPRMWALDYVVKAAAKGHDVVFTFSASDLVAARTFVDLKNAVTPVGATVHIR